MGMIMMISIMMPMDIQVIGVQQREEHADVQVQVIVPAIQARALIEISVPAPANSSRNELAEIAYDKALMMLDPE